MKQIVKDEIIKKIKNKEIKQSRSIWKFLSDDMIKEIEKSFGKTKVERLYNWLYEIKERTCKHCGSLNEISFRNFINGYSKFCSTNCASNWYRINETVEQKKLKGKKISKSLNSKSNEEWTNIKTKQKKTKLEKYGDENYNNVEKNNKTMLERYGSKHALSVPEFNKKFKKTLGEKDWSDANKKRKETLIRNTGYEHQLQNPKVQEKMKNTIIEKYGVENVSQSPKIAEKKLKSSYLKKEYILPSGKKILIQGYEDIVINKLLETHNEEDLILVQTEMPEIWYQQGDKKHRYIPDIYIISENKIIEVKSDRTMNLHLEKNKLKKKRCIEMGLGFEFMIYDGKMNRIDEKEFL